MFKQNELFCTHKINPESQYFQKKLTSQMTKPASRHLPALSYSFYSTKRGKRQKKTKIS